MREPSSLIIPLRSLSDWKILSRYSRNPTASSTIVSRCCVEMAPSSSIIPWCMMIGLLGFAVAWLAVAIMERTGLSRHVWNLPLLFLALVVLFGSVIGLALLP